MKREKRKDKHGNKGKLKNKKQQGRQQQGCIFYRIIGGNGFLINGKKNEKLDT